MSETVYSVINLNNLNPKDRVKPGEDVVYSEVKISDRSRGQKVSSDNLKTETTGSSTLSWRRSTVCLGVLCLLLIGIIILGVYFKPKQHIDDYRILVDERNQIQGNYSILVDERNQIQGNYSILVDERNQIQGNYSILAKEKEELLLVLNNITHLQEQNYQLQKNFSITVKNMAHLQEQNYQLQKNYAKLEDMKNNLVGEKNYFQQQCSNLNKDKEVIQRNYDALLSKLPLLQKYCHTNEKGRVCDPCPQGWEKHNAKCYYFSTNVTTWNESQNNCIMEAAHLVTVNSEEEQDFISNERSGSYWIGLTDSKEEGVWRWVDGTDLKKEEKRFWLYGEPDNKDQQSAGIKANCVINSKEWRDEPCEHQYRWICETQTLLPKPLHI